MSDAHPAGATVGCSGDPVGTASLGGGDALREVQDVGRRTNNKHPPAEQIEVCL